MAHENNTPRAIIKAASACVWRGDAVLLARRGNAFGHGYWSLPGGKIKPGESAIEAAVRELLEETGITANLVHHVGDFNLAGDGVDYVISCWTGYYLSGDAAARSDAMAAQWLDYQAIGGLKLAFNTAEAVARARAVLVHC